MSVNGVTSVGTDAYSGYTASATAKTTEPVATGAATATVESGVVYEPSSTSEVAAKKTYTQDTNLIAKLKADAEARTAQLRSLVEQMMGKQANAYGNANDIWKFLASGNYTVDPATKAQAQADIAEDGYWGVEQTSDRIIDFANALTGGNPDKLEEMRDAFLKGYEQAQETWGGELPDISKRTYEAVLDKFDKLAEESGVTLPELNGNY